MRLERLILVDVETTGIEPATSEVIEVGALLFDVEHAEVLEAHSCLVKAERNPAAFVNQIGERLLHSLPDPFIESRAFDPLYKMVAHAGAFVAHSAAFDRRFFPNDLARLMPWICTQFGTDWPRGKWGSSLVNTALAHGVGVSASHRALDDCLLLARTLRAANQILHDDDVVGLDLSAMLSKALARGVGTPVRCSVADETGQCRSWARTYLKSVVAPRCEQHGGSRQWVA